MGTAFWDRNAGRYDRFMARDAGAYYQLYERMAPWVQDKTVLELATGTGQVAAHMAKYARTIEATDLSSEMIARAKALNRSTKLHFSVQDMEALPYADSSFQAVIVCNALHILAEPERALAEIRRVLAPGGVLLAPTFVHGEDGLRAKVRAGLMGLAGFPLESRWTQASFLLFLQANSWQVLESETLRASFPLCWAVCTTG